MPPNSMPPNTNIKVVSTELLRNIIDKFYTNPLIAIKCITCVSILDIDKQLDLIIEPSAGAGVFISLLRNLCDNVKSYDILPESGDIKYQDFLTLD